MGRGESGTNGQDAGLSLREVVPVTSDSSPRGDAYLIVVVG
jgi:hypothetical protein